MSRDGCVRSCLVLLLAILVCGSCSGQSRPASEEPLRVLHLDSYHHDSLWSISLNKGIRHIFDKYDDAVLMIEHMDTKTLSSEEYFASLATFYKNKYKNIHFNVIIASDNNALNFLFQYRDRIFPGVPVVFCGINNYTPDMLKGRIGYTGVVEAVDMEETVQVAQKLFPGATSLFVITDKTTTGQVNKQLFLQAAQKMLLQIPCTIREDWDMDGLLQEVEILPADTIILRLGLNRDKHGCFIDEIEGISLLANRAQAPIFTCWEYTMKTGVLGGKVVSGVRQGEEAGKIARRVLEGESPDVIPVQTKSPNRYIFDGRVLRRFGLKSSNLPSDSEIIFPHPSSFYQRHRVFIWVMGMAFVVLLLTVLYLLIYVLRRRRRETRLRESEAHWRMLYEGLPGYSFIIDEDGFIEDVNEVLCQLTGYSRGELIGKPCQLLCTETPQTCPIHRCQADQYVNLEGTIRSKDGRTIPVLRSIRRVSLGSRNVVIENFQDITARKEAEESLRKSEETERISREKLTALHEVIVDLTTQRDWEGLCRRAVELAHNRLGFERVGIWFKCDDPDIVYGSYGIDENGMLRDERGVQLSVAGDARIRQALQESSPKTFCCIRRLHNHRGVVVGEGPNVVSTFWNGSEIIGFITADTLITGKEIPPVQQHLMTLLAAVLANLITAVNTERERMRLASAIEQASEAVIITSDDGTVEYVNQGTMKILGYDAEDVLDHNMTLFYDHQFEPESLESMIRAMVEGRTWAKRMVVRKKNGESLEVDVNLSPVRHEEGDITHFVHVLRDISKESQLEAQLRQAAKMEAIGRLAGGIAHDFNNQLTVVRGYCDLLLRDLEEGSPVRECIEQMDHATRQASTLTSELLSFSRKQILKPQVVNPNRIIEDIRKSLGLVGEDVRLKMELQDDVWNIRVDPNRLEQAVMNLTINARDAMPHGGDLAIRTANIENAEDLLALRAIGLHGPMVMIEVEDTGLGMDAETTEQIFEPFFSTKKKGKGTGLGLSMVYGFVQQSDGHIQVESQPGRGTSFRMYMPRVTDPLDEEPSLNQAAPAEGGNETILVVEDDQTVRQLVVRVLREHGYNVIETGFPEEAPSLVEKNEGPIDLLVSDVVMPGTSGPMLARMLRQRQKFLRVLFISGFTDEKTLRREIHFAKVNFLQKPFSPEDLCHAVKQALRA